MLGPQFEEYDVIQPLNQSPYDLWTSSKQTFNFTDLLCDEADDRVTQDTETQSEGPGSYLDELTYLLKTLQAPNEYDPYRKLPPKLRNSHRLTLVLDLDETLIHSEITPVDSPDLVFPNPYDNGNSHIYVKYRPYLTNFLEIVSRFYDVAVFTASEKEYADTILNEIDPEYRHIRYRLYREDCTKAGNSYVKDLRTLGRELSEVIIVDNAIESFAFQLDNGILIQSWYNDPEDSELLLTVQSLLEMLDAEDVREMLREKYGISAALSQNIYN